MPYPLNLLDLTFTLYAINHGALELNPLMRCVPFMVFYKVVIVGVACWWLHRCNAVWSLRFLTAVYAAVNIYHLIGVMQLWL